MPSPHPVRVALDLETTGLSPEQDAIIEIGAVKFAGDRVIETFETFVAPNQPLPYRIQRLTGIAPRQLRDAPQIGAVLPRLRAFLGDLPLVGHNVPFDAAFLRRFGAAARNPLLDTYELASVLLPNAANYTLATVGTTLGVSSPTHHRALADAQLTRAVFLALLARLDVLDETTAAALADLPAPADWTPRALLRARHVGNNGGLAPSAFGGLLGASLGEQLRAKLGMDPAALTLAIADDANGSTPAPASEPMPEVPETPSSALAGLRDRVAACLREGGAMLAEVTAEDDGIICCLEPALRWASESGQRLLVAAPDGAEMARLARTVLPALAVRLNAGGTDGRALAVAELGEHTSYACLHRWYGGARDAGGGTFGLAEARGLAKLAVWVQGTHTGSRADVHISGVESPAWERTRSGAEFADSTGDCPYRGDGYCFVERARDRAGAANVVVTTHAALAAHLTGTDATHLPDAARTLVLDASRFEDVLRREGEAVLDRATMLDLLARLGHASGGGTRSGLLPRAADLLHAEAAHTRTWYDTLARATRATERFFAGLGTLLAETRDGRDGGEQRLLPLDSYATALPAWDVTTEAWNALATCLTALDALVRDTARDLAARATPGPLRDGIAAELLASGRRLTASAEHGQRVFADSGGEQRISWLRVPYPAPGEQSDANGRSHPQRSGGTGGDASQRPEATMQQPPEVHSTTAHVGRQVAPLYAPGHGVVFSGQALAVAGSFAHVRHGLGLPDSTATAALPDDRRLQTLLALPGDVPEPNAPTYQKRLDEAIIALARSLSGRVVVLLPSHAALRVTYQGVRRALERHDILVLGQGQDGSARQLWTNFEAQERIVLLGAGAFWDGTPRVARPPACVVVPRLPFPALSDPLLAARADGHDDPQADFVVPHAALKLRQALLGLAWGHSARNAIVLFDRRVQTRGYGSAILGTLPRCTQERGEVADLVERITDWVD